MRKLILLLSLLSVNSGIWGNPENPVVTEGSATFVSLDSKTLSVSASDKAIISWDSFSIDASESTYFMLPDTNSAVLNRVTSSLPSTIAGRLQSNGEVYLINPNGVLITESGAINTAAFLASTLDILDSQFLHGEDLVFEGASASSIINHGIISTWNGDLILLARHVINEGLLNASEGVVALGAGDKILLSSSKDQRIAVQISSEKISDGIGIDQQGMIHAIQAELKADGNLYALAIQQDGLVNATATLHKQGRVFLVAEEGITSVNGSIAAVGNEGKGGEIRILGDSIALHDLANIDVSGSCGGGVVYIGGGDKGNNPEILNARNLYVSPQAKVYAQAKETGDGGKVVFWSEEMTIVEGFIDLTGGPLKGNGGFIEVSSRGFLSYEGIDDRRAPLGNPGTLLLDPTTITISAAGPNTNINFGPASCAANTFCGCANTATIMISNGATGLLDRLALGPVIVDSAAGTGAATAALSTITIANPIVVNVNNPLTFNANSSININAAVTNNGTSTVTFNTGFAASSPATNNNININAAVRNTSTGSIALNSATLAGHTGDITINNTGSIVNSGNGSITLSAGTAANGNVTFQPSSSISNTNNGNITINCGSPASTGTITFSTTSSLSNTGTSGTFTINGRSTASGSALIFSPIFTASSSGAFKIMITQGLMTSNTTISFTGGAPVTVQNTASSITISGPSMSFSGGAGPLIMTASSGLTIPATNISYTGTSVLTSQNNGMGFSGSFTNSGSGTVNLFSGVNANGNITFNAGINLRNTSSGALNLTAGNTGNGTTGTITTSTTSAITNSGTGTMSFTGRSTTSGTAVSLSGPITASSPGAFTVTALQGNIVTVATTVMNFSGGAPVTFQAAGSFTLAGNPMNFSGGVGPLVVTGAAASTISGPINLSYTGTSSITDTNGTLSVNTTFTNSSTGILNVSAGTLANGGITFGTGAGFTNSGNGAVNLVVGSPTTTGTITTSTTSTITNSGTSGTVSMVTQGVASSFAYNIQGPIVSSSSGMFLIRSTQGALTTTAGATMNFSVGAPVTFQATGATSSISLGGSSMSFTGPGGSLTVSAGIGLFLNGPITYSFTGDAQFSAATSSITTNASANMTFNSGAGNVSFSTPLSNITTNASATLLFNAGAGNLTMIAGTNPTNAGTITNNSTVTFNSGAGKTMTLSCFGALITGTINYGSRGLCSLTAAGASGSIATNAATTLNWGPSGLSAGNLQMNADTTITTNGNIIFSPTSGVSSPALSMVAGTSITINGTVDYSSPFNWTITNTNGTISNGVSGAITINSGAGNVTVTGNATSGNSINLQAPVTSHATSSVTFTANTGNITSTAAAVFTFDHGSPVTIQTLAPLAAITWASGSSMTPSSFSGGVGPLTFSAVGTLSLNGSTIYGYTGPLTLLSTTGVFNTNATGNLTANSGSGDVNITTPLGAITANAASLFLFNSGAGNLTMSAGTSPTTITAITAPGTITFNSGVGKALTITASGAIALNTINYGSTGTANITAQNGSLTTGAGTTLNWGPGGLSAGNLVLSALLQMTTNGNIVFSSTAGSSSPALSMTAGGGMIINGPANVYASPFSWTVQNTLGSISTGSGSGIVFNSGAGPFVMTATNPSTTAINLTGNLTSHATSLLNFVALSGNIASTSASVFSTDNGAPVTFQANTVASQSITLLGNYSFTGGAGPLQILSSGSITLTANLSYAYSLPAIVNGFSTYTNTGTLNIAGSGGFDIAAGAININGPVVYTSTGDFNLAAVSTIVVSAPISMNTPATLSMATTSVSLGDIFIRNLVRNSGTGPMTVTAARDFLVGEENVVNSYQLGSAGGDLTFNIGRDLVVRAFGELGNPTYAQIGYHTGNINSNIIFNTIGRNVLVYGGWFPLTYAIIGHGSQQPGATGGTRNGNIIFGSAMNQIPGTVTVMAYDMSTDFGTNSNSFAQIGHTRSLSGTPVTATGNIDLRFINGNVTVSGQNSLGAYALIGHGGASSPQSDSFSGNVQVNTLSSINIEGGSFSDAFAGIGHVAILNAPGTVTLQSDLIETISGAGLQVQASSGAEVVIGLYVKATAAGGVGAISAVTPMTVPQITVDAGGDLYFSAAVPSDSFNGVLVGALSYTGAIPFIAAGDVGCNIDLSGGGNLSLFAGRGGNSSNTFAYVTNGIGSPMGTFDVTLDVASLIFIQGGENTAAIDSIGTLEVSSMGMFEALSSSGQALLRSVGDLSLSASSVAMIGNKAASQIQTTAGNVSIVSGLTELIANASINSGGSLMMTLSGDLFLSDKVTLSSVGAYTITGTGKAFLGGLGDVLLTGSSGSLSITGDLFLIADALGSSQITAAGNLSVASSMGSVYLTNFTGQNASINSMIGSLSVTANRGCYLLDGADMSIATGTSGVSVTATTGTLLLDFGSNITNGGTGFATLSAANITIDGGSQVTNAGSMGNPLTINATTGNLILGEGVLIQNSGVGGYSSTVAQALNINGGPSAGTAIFSGSGGAVINASYVNMSGTTPATAALISSAGSGLSITATDVSLSPNASIALANSGNYLINASGELSVNNATLQNNGPGTTTISIGNNINLIEGAVLQGNIGDLTLSTSAGDIQLTDLATVTTLGTLTITGMQDALLSNATIKSSLSVPASTLSVTIDGNLNLLNVSTIFASGGSGLLSVETTTGHLNLNNAGNIRHSGTGGIAITAGDSTFVRGGSRGDSFISGNSTLVATVSEALVIQSANNGKGYLSSAGTTSISSSRLELVGISASLPASISNSAGNLTISSGNANMSDFAQIKLTAGSGNLSVNTTSGDFKIANGSTVQHQGSGPVNSTVAATLLIEGGPLGVASILGNTAGGTISADTISLKGFTTAFNALISMNRGTLAISSTRSMNLDTHAKIALTNSTGMNVLSLMIGEDLFVGNDSIVQNLGTNTSTSVVVTGTVSFFGGAGDAVLQGNSGALSLVSTGSIHFASDLTGTAYITSAGNVTLSAMEDVVFSGSSGSANASSITTTAGELSVSANNNLTLRDRANFTTTTGSGVLTLNIGADLNLENGATIAQKGTGTVNSTIGGNLLIRGGPIGGSQLSCNAGLNMSVSGEINLEAVSGAQAMLASQGATTISAFEITQSGFDATSPALIKNTTGNLTINAESINLLNYGQIKLTAGTGVLTVNATAGDLRLTNGSVISNAGTGSTGSSVNNTLYIEGGSLGGASFTSGTGGMTVAARDILMTGFSSNNPATLSSAQGNLQVTSTLTISLNPFANLTLTAGSGTLDLMVGSDLFVANGSSIQCGGSAAGNIQVSGIAMLLGGAGDSFIKGNTGFLSIDVGDNLRIASDISGKAFIISNGPLSVTAGGDISLLGAFEAALPAFIQTSANTLTVTAANSLLLYDTSNISITAGTGTLTVDTTSGDLYIENGSFLQNKGTGALLSSIGGNAVIKSGLAGSSFVSSNGLLTFDVTEDLTLETAANASSYLFCKGNSTINSSRLFMNGFNSSSSAYIEDTTGSLSVTAESINMLNFATIKLNAGAAALTANATTGDFRINNGSKIQHLGTGAINSTTAGTLYIFGSSAASSIAGGTGGAVVVANAILMGGASTVLTAAITSTQGNLSVTTTGMLNLTPFSKINLNGGSGNLTVNVGGTLYEVDAAQIHNFGSGMTTITSGMTVICH